VEKKMKEDAKRSAQNQLRDWMANITIDDFVLSADGTTIAEIDAKPTDKYNMLYLQALCSKLKINGYKTEDEMRQSDYSRRGKGSH
jgi:hypothetical protein